MVHFFGIFSPGQLVRNSTDEAPAKANFFGGLQEKTSEDALSRLEHEASYLAGKAPEPEPRDVLAVEFDGTLER